MPKSKKTDWMGSESSKIQKIVLDMARSGVRKGTTGNKMVLWILVFIESAECVSVLQIVLTKDGKEKKHSSLPVCSTFHFVVVCSSSRFMFPFSGRIL